MVLGGFERPASRHLQCWVVLDGLKTLSDGSGWPICSGLLQSPDSIPEPSGQCNVVPMTSSRTSCGMWKQEEIKNLIDC